MSPGDFTIQWRSAAPIKEALRKAPQPAPSAADADVPKERSKEDNPKDALEEPREYYVIALTGIHSGLAKRDPDSFASNIEANAELKVKGKTLQPVKVDVTGPSDAPIVLVKFSKTEPITVKDKEVEFVAKFGRAEVKKKFVLKEMVYKGKLEL